MDMKSMLARGEGTYGLHFVGSQENNDDGDMLIVDHRPIVSDRRGQRILTDEKTGITNSLNESTHEKGRSSRRARTPIDVALM